VAKFTLPTGWYEQTLDDFLDRASFGELNRSSAWKYALAAVMWSEGHADDDYLHLNDRLSSKQGKELANRGRDYLEQHLGQEPLELIDVIGRAYGEERARQGQKRDGWQRNNVTGQTFEVVLQLLIDRLCGVKPARTPALRTLRGFELAPEGYHSQPDLALFSERDFRLLISTKWTLRKERIGTYLHEAWFYRQRRPDLQIAFVVGEFNLNILEWLALDPLVDRVYHVHLPMLLAVHEPFLGQEQVPRSTLIGAGTGTKSYQRWVALKSRLFDMSQLFEDIDRLNPANDPEPDVLDIIEQQDEEAADGDT
jgi:hypothetical protein